MPYRLMSISLPSPEVLATELTGGTVDKWLTNGKLSAISLSVKYAILHKIEIAN